MKEPMNEQTNAIDSLLCDLIDYAGLYPPAGLDMYSAFRNHMSYMNGKHSSALGRFVVDLNRLPELCRVAGESIREMRLSILATPALQLADLAPFLDDDLPIEAIEIRTDHPSEIRDLGERIIPSGILIYFEVRLPSVESETFDAIAETGARVKLRTGGVIAEAFPSSEAIVNMLKVLADRRIPFKATAGLHHPIRGAHPYTYAPQSPVGMMHGFLNLFLAATLLYFDGAGAEAKQLLEEKNAEAFSLSPEEIAYGSFRYTADQLRKAREEFAISFGSCSFEEPIRDLEALGWV